MAAKFDVEEASSSVETEAAADSSRPVTKLRLYLTQRN